LFPPDLAWDLSLNSVLEAPPAFNGDRAYFPIADNRIAAYDIRHGTLLWIAPGTPRFEPIVAEDLLFEIDAEAIIALHTDTGVEAWRFELAEPLSAPLSWGNGWLVATTSAGTVFAFRASDGGLIWRRELDAVIHARATVAQNRVYVPMNDGRIIALQVENGEPVWERRLGGAPNEIAATPERVYAGSNDNFFYALRARDGLIEWRWSTGADVIGRPVVDAQRVYFVSFDNVLRALDKNIGNQRWKRPLSIRPTRGHGRHADRQRRVGFCAGLHYERWHSGRIAGGPDVERARGGSARRHGRRSADGDARPAGSHERDDPTDGDAID